VKAGRHESVPPATKAPAPVEAGANLLVHDLKNLAGRLAALGENLNHHYDDPLFKESARSLLDDTVLHLKRLASDLRDREGRIIIKLRVDLNQVLADALLDTRPDLEANLRVSIHLSEIPQIWGDAYLLRLAFGCAIENALSAMNKRGVLTIRSVVTGKARRSRRPRIVVEIADDGPGMSSDFLRDRLFQPFSTTKDGGLGLGVYTIRQVARLHEATVQIESAVGTGTLVRFRFPASAT